MVPKSILETVGKNVDLNAKLGEVKADYVVQPLLKYASHWDHDITKDYLKSEPFLREVGLQWDPERSVISYLEAVFNSISKRKEIDRLRSPRSPHKMGMTHAQRKLVDTMQRVRSNKDLSLEEKRATVADCMQKLKDSYSENIESCNNSFLAGSIEDFAFEQDSFSLSDEFLWQEFWDWIEATKKYSFSEKDRIIINKVVLEDMSNAKASGGALTEARVSQIIGKLRVAFKDFMDHA